MAIFDLFSKRQKQLRGEFVDVYTYSELPEALRVQVIHILRDAFGPIRHGPYDGPNAAARIFEEIHKALCREYGVFSLATRRNEDSWGAVTNFILTDRNHEKVLDAIELCVKIIDRLVRENPHEYAEARQEPDDAIEELNLRFREHGVGYSYESGCIVRIDHQFVHTEVVRPALQFLADKSFTGPNQEFLNAHEHYRAGREKECIAECLKAFESTIKAICDRRKWRYNPNDTAKALIDVLFSQKLISDYLQSEFAALRTILESGVPTTRNRTSGHGQGSSPIAIPTYLASYVLHLTASTILFLCDADKNLK